MAALKPSDSDNTPREPVHFFTVKHINRASEMRKDTQLLQKTLQIMTDTRIIVLVNKFPVMVTTDKDYNVRMFKYSELKEFIDADSSNSSPLVFLGKRLAEDNSESGALFAANFTKGNLSTVVQCSDLTFINLTTDSI